MVTISLLFLEGSLFFRNCERLLSWRTQYTTRGKNNFENFKKCNNLYGSHCWAPIKFWFKIVKIMIGFTFKIQMLVFASIEHVQRIFLHVNITLDMPFRWLEVTSSDASITEDSSDDILITMSSLIISSCSILQITSRHTVWILGLRTVQDLQSQ